MKTDRTTIKDPSHPDYYAEARDAIMDCCPFYDPNHKGGIVREAVFRECLKELRERVKWAEARRKMIANLACFLWEEHKEYSMEKHGVEGCDVRGSDSEAHQMLEELVEESRAAACKRMADEKADEQRDRSALNAGSDARRAGLPDQQGG